MSFTFVPVWLLLQSLAGCPANAGFIGARAPAPAIPSDIGLSACETAFEYASFCESVSPGFSTLPPSQQAPCLCYSSTVWEPNLFDDVVLTCAEYASTADPSDYSIIAGLEGFCSSVGDVLNQPASVPATTTSSPQSTGNLDSNPDCSFIGYAFSFCDSVTPGFTTLPPSLQAPCLCYSSTDWEPTIFDNAVATCVEYASTAVPSDYSILAPLEGFCSSVGNVLTQPASVPATTTSSPQSTGNLDSNPDCSFIGYAFSFCDSVTPGFTTLPPSLQAPCLCYSSTDWEPTIFDNAVATCVEYASTAVPSDYSILTTLENFCSSVGNVLTQPASAPATTTSSPQSIGSLDSNPDCSFIGYAFSFCDSVTPGFTTLPPSLQAPCLCYSSTDWEPTIFDNAVATCVEYASTAVPSDYSILTSLEDFCSSVGNVLTQPASKPAKVTGATTAKLSSEVTGTKTAKPPTTASTAPTTAAPIPGPSSTSTGPKRIVSEAGTDSLIRRDGVMMKCFWSILSVVSSVLFHL